MGAHLFLAAVLTFTLAPIPAFAAIGRAQYGSVRAWWTS
jgi:hypothetical protein